MSKKIASEFAIGVILLIVIVISGIFWLSEKKQELQSINSMRNAAQYRAISKKPNADDARQQQEIKQESQSQDTGKPTCLPHYYEGEATIKGWLADSSRIEDKTLTIKIINQDIDKLPTAKADSSDPNFTLTLIDPTDENRKELKEASQKNPANLTIHGYAQVCQINPQISIQQATIAFKKS